MNFNEKVENSAPVTEILRSIRQLMKNNLSTDFVSANTKILELTEVIDDDKNFELDIDELFNKDTDNIHHQKRTAYNLNSNLFNPILSESSIIDNQAKNELSINKSYNITKPEIHSNNESIKNQDSLTKSVDIIQSLIDQVNSLQKQLDDKDIRINGTENKNNTIDQLVKDSIKSWLETNLPKIASDLIEREIRQFFSSYDLKK